MSVLHAGAGGEPAHDKEPAADTALHLAAQRGDEAGILRLLKQGVCVNVRGGDVLETPLVCVLTYYDPSEEMDIDRVVQEMIAAGADQNIPDKRHRTALMMALITLSHRTHMYHTPASVCITLIEAGQ